MQVAFTQSEFVVDIEPVTTARGASKGLKSFREYVGADVGEMGAVAPAPARLSVIAADVSGVVEIQ